MIVHRRQASSRVRTLVLMALGVAATLVTEIWDARQEDASVLRDLAHEQLVLGRAIVGRSQDQDPSPDDALADAAQRIEAICGPARAVEANGAIRVLLERASGEVRDCNGAPANVPSLRDALGAGLSSTLLTRDEATRLGLPARTAVAGIVRAPHGVWSALAVVSSAGPERDRVRHQQARTIVSVSSVSVMIVGFGLVALRRQRRELALARQVELARAREERDAELAKANRMATLAALASGFAHEIGTPLGIISGRVEQLRSPNAPAVSERRQELLTQVASQVDRIGKLIRSFLGFARGEASMLVEARAEDVARSALRLVDHRFDAAGVDLHFKARGGDVRMVCEPALFEQVLVNLLANALEASVAGQKVTLVLEHSGSDLSFTVRDEGSGVPEAALERVMEPFFTTKAGRGGTGLGLTIAREIVAHHRGEIAIRRRTDGDGTEVTVRVPRVSEA